MLASLVGFLGGDFDLAEDAAQEAFAIAAERWPRTGVPANPGAWLITTARNRAIDRLRRERTLAAKTRQLATPDAVHEDPDAPGDDMTIPDERLELVFTCCHPALATEAQVALTLRALGGLSTEEIARAFLVSPETMKRRLTRRQGQDQDGGDPVRRPGRPPAARAAGRRTRGRVPDLQRGLLRPLRPRRRGDPARRACSPSLMPDEPEVLGLLALMRLHDSRRAARFAGGELVLLADQDRSLWDAAQIEAGRAELDRAICGATVAVGAGPTSCRRRSPRCRPTMSLDWPQIAALYGELVRVSGSAVAELNRAVAVAEAEGAGGRPGDRRRPRARWLPVPALHPSRAVAPAGAPRGGPSGLPPRPRARPPRARARLPGAPAGRTVSRQPARAAISSRTTSTSRSTSSRRVRQLTIAGRSATLPP